MLGVVTSVIGSLQASAALQIAAGVSHDLFESLTLFNVVPLHKMDDTGEVLDTITYRFSGHSPSDAMAYRTKEELDLWRGQDRLARPLRPLE